MLRYKKRHVGNASVNRCLRVLIISSLNLDASPEWDRDGLIALVCRGVSIAASCQPKQGAFLSVPSHFSGGKGPLTVCCLEATLANPDEE